MAAARPARRPAGEHSAPWGYHRRMSGRAESIDEVIASLDDIIDRSITASSRLGYFAALYRKVTVRVRDSIAEGFFDDGSRMERLDVIFANRYLDAYGRFERGDEPSSAWRYAFDVADQRRPIVLQHLLLGMNAHINLDLGIAAAQAVPASALPSLRDDFNRINVILGSLVGEIQRDLAEVWMTLRLFNRYLGSVEKALINFSMEIARDEAWALAEQLAPLSEVERDGGIIERDREVRELAEVIRHPGVLLGAVTTIVRLGERGSVPRIIGILR